MIRFDHGNRRFNYRVVGVAIHNDVVLLHRIDRDPFWTLPGGRPEHGETAEQTIRREMFEEIETQVVVERLLWVVENFFDYDGLSYHELSLYFLVRFRPDSMRLRTETFEGADANVPLKFRWVPATREALSALPLRPTFLYEGLIDLPQATTHVVQRD